MAPRPIEVQVYPAYAASVKGAWLRKVARAGLAVGDLDGEAGAGIVIANDETLRRLNRDFRGVDQVTDVLSFGDSPGEWEGDAPPAGATAAGVDFPGQPEGARSLGEVIISYPQAERQARERGLPTERELALLVVHGMLHLLGHDHAEPDETATMQRLEREALARVFPEKGRP